ncbi:phytanoyl-CoA dioxygenase family protein [Pleomorphovibrio marinus]|uniref:phytanoyl-CoA dioxygenase family protein n=1 Tax=Pleomorphovibrio marinus TaxID=2164132 RepID=UPI000E0A479D|nr:phytanoyl-CoA dioxygenase family protein [Pleomorphovibrio marinus]
MKVLSSTQIEEFNKDGYLVLRGFLSPKEVEFLYNASAQDSHLTAHTYAVLDANGNESRLALWNDPGEDPFGMLSRDERVVGAIGQLIGGPVAHFHSKVMQKSPKVGGAWEWHQDYGYWYKNGFLFPDEMVSIMFALTPANKENGCLMVLPKSHKMGRIEHGKVGEQVGAELDRVQRYEEQSERVYCELAPGDALIFHSNLLHASNPNTSDHPRWSIISCYNSLHNTPYKEPSSCFKEVQTVPTGSILKDSKKGFDGISFNQKKGDVSLK